MRNKGKIFNIKIIGMAIMAMAAIASCDDDEGNFFDDPIALFNTSPLVATVGDNITFNDESGDVNNQIIAWSWDFGDGGTSTEQNPVYSYDDPGEYTVRLEVLNDAQETSFATQTVTVNPFKLLWSFSTGASISPSAPAIASDGTIVFGSRDNNVYALNQDGTEKWSFATMDGIRSSPAIGEDGTVYIGSLDDNFYALDGDTGSQKWIFTTGANIFITSPAIAADGTIYIGSDDFNLYALNPDGTEKWRYTTGSQVRSAPAIDMDGTIYFGSNDANVYALNPDGTLKWSFPTGARVEPHPIIGSDGTIYAGSSDGNFYAINPDGTQKWVFATADSNQITGSAAIGLDGNVYFGTKEGANGTGSIIYAVTPAGTEAWKIVLEPETDLLSSRMLSSPTVGADGTVYFGGFDGIMYGINADGSIKFKFEVDNDPNNKFDQAIWTSVALNDNGILYFGDGPGDFHAIQVSNRGTADTAWPTQSKNNRRTGL